MAVNCFVINAFRRSSWNVMLAPPGLQVIQLATVTKLHNASCDRGGDVQLK